MTAETSEVRVAMKPDHPDLDESVVIALAASGNREAYGALFDRHFDALYGFAAAATLTVEGAEEVTARTFEGAFSGLRDEPGDVPFKTTLFRRAIEESHVQTTLENPIEPTPTGLPDVWHQFTIEERHVLALAYISKCSRDEIAGILETTPECIDEIIDGCKRRKNPLAYQHEKSSV